MLRALAFCLACALVPFAPRARAQDQDASAPAQDLFAQGERAYAEGRFTDAAGLMREAYRLSPDPILLYNLARALEAAHDWEAAAEAYSQYLATPGEHTHQGRAEAHLRAAQQELERERALREAAQARPVEAPVRPAAPSRPFDPLPWVLAGAGALVVGAGAVFGVLMLDRQSAAQAATTHAMAYPAAQDGDLFAITADILFITGGLVAAVGVAWGVVGLVSGGPSAEVAVGPGSVSLRGTF